MSDVDDVGYGRPPTSTRFKKGRSGNPKGRPPGSRSEAPYEAVLGQMVMIREGGVERQLTAAEAFLLKIAKQGLEGDGAAARSALKAIEKARADRQQREEWPDRINLTIVYVRPGGVTTALEPLRMARKLDRFRKTARMALEPWIVEAALARFGDKRLTVEEQKIVLEATRTPAKVRWPDWWEVMP